MKKRIAVAMSGGVDSSATAYLLKQQGHEVIGLFMSPGICLEKSAPKRKACCSLSDANDARKVAEKIGIEFTVLDFKAEFEKLINYFCREYDQGRTPNPCIRCNQHLKFGKLWEYAEKSGADFIATGHYARIVPPSTREHVNTWTRELIGSPRYILKKGVDPNKDQSYVLFSLNQEQLSHIQLPLGDYTKEQVRKMAHDLNLPVKDKLESQEICFVPDNDCAKFLKSRMPERIKKGEIRDLDGKFLGTHPGYQLFTIGQRHGLKIALGKPVYVIQIIPRTNTIIIGSKKDVFRKGLLADEINWVSLPGLEAGKTLEVAAKIRYKHQPVPAKLSLDSDQTKVRVEFNEPQPAITPGQAVVFYQGDVVMGGGWIKSAL